MSLLLKDPEHPGHGRSAARHEWQLPGTCGSQQWLRSEDDDLLFDKESRGLQYAVRMPVGHSSPGTMTGRPPWNQGIESTEPEELISL